MPEHGSNQLEIYNAALFLQPDFPNDDFFVVGFVCGFISQDHVLEQIYLDSFLTTAKLEGQDVTNALEQLSAVGEKFNVKFVVSMSLDKEEVPASLQDKIITAL